MSSKPITRPPRKDSMNPASTASATSSGQAFQLPKRTNSSSSDNMSKQISKAVGEGKKQYPESVQKRVQPRIPPPVKDRLRTYKSAHASTRINGLLLSTTQTTTKMDIDEPEPGEDTKMEDAPALVKSKQSIRGDEKRPSVTFK